MVCKFTIELWRGAYVKSHLSDIGNNHILRKQKLEITWFICWYSRNEIGIYEWHIKPKYNIMATVM
jgi:hypothetical protein